MVIVQSLPKPRRNSLSSYPTSASRVTESAFTLTLDHPPSVDRLRATMWGMVKILRIRCRSLDFQSFRSYLWRLRLKVDDLLLGLL